MKASELMIGDWVAIRMNHSTKEYKEGDYIHHKVSSGLHLRNGEIDLISIENNQRYDGYGEDFCLSIPLTAEILEKNGFRISNDFAFAKNTKCDIKIDLTNQINSSISSYNGVSIYMNFQYVHELQHALRLCKLKELANNFKI